MQEKSIIKSNILQFLEYKCITKYKFYKDTGITRGVLDQNNGMSEENTASFLAYYPEVNSEWLLTGKGEMLKENMLPVEVSRPNYESKDYKPKPFIVDAYAQLGKPNGFAIAVKADKCEQVSIPFISDYDFSIKGRGNSMINRKNPDRSICDGDLVACKLWTSRSHIRWGQVYALATSEGVIIKQIKESTNKENIQCVSFNEEDGYAPYDLPVSEIHDWAIVVYVTHTSKW